MADLFSGLLDLINLENNFDYNSVMEFINALINKLMELFESR